MVFTQQNRLGADDQQSSKRIHRPCSEKNFRAVLKVANASDADRRARLEQGPPNSSKGPSAKKPGLGRTSCSSGQQPFSEMHANP